MIREVSGFLKMNDVEYKEGKLLSNISPINIGGRADLVAYPNNENDFISLIAFLENIKISYKIVGRMSNILFGDDNYNGVVVRTDRINQYNLNRTILTASCGVSLPYIAKILCASGISGFERIAGIPGSIAGAIVGNAGAFDDDISSKLIIVKVYDPSDKEIYVLNSDEMEFSYRHSFFTGTDLVVLSAVFSLAEADSASVSMEMVRCAKIRAEMQPVGVPSLGSTFKRPGKDLFAARLIDECGLKGYMIGGAQISEKHAGFIVNRGGATARNYKELSDYAAECVLKRFGVRLEREVEIL